LDDEGIEENVDIQSENIIAGQVRYSMFIFNIQLFHYSKSVVLLILRLLFKVRIIKSTFIEDQSILQKKDILFK
jgi:hypothetical protein